MRLRHVLLFLTPAVLRLAAPAHGSSHMEAPLMVEDRAADATDFYAFRSFEPGKDGTVVFIAGYVPFEYPGGGPNASLGLDGSVGSPIPYVGQQVVEIVTRLTCSIHRSCLAS